MPSTWSCQKMLSSSTSGYQRYWVNSVPAASPTGCAFESAAFNVTVFPAIEVICLTSIDSVPRPMPIQTLLQLPPPAQLCWNFATLESDSVVEEIAAFAVRTGSSALYVRTDCSNDIPLITP